MLEIKLKNTYKKLIHYFSIFTIILGTTFGSINSANAAGLTVVTSTADISTTNDAGGDNATLAYDAASSITVAADTDDSIIYVFGNNAGDIFNFTSTLTIQNLYAVDAAASETLAVSTVGTLNVTGATAITSTATANVNTNSSAVLTLKNNATFTGAVTLTETLTSTSNIILGDGELATTVTFTGGLLVANNGDGKLQVSAGEELQTIAGNIGTTTLRIGEVETNSIATISGAVAAALVDVNAATTFSSTVNSTAVTVDSGSATFTGLLTAGTVAINQAVTASSGITATTITLGGTDDVLTSSGDITSAIVLTDSASKIVLAGADMTVTGDINAAGTTDAGIIDVTGAKVTFVGNLGASADTNLDTLTIAASKRAVITETANFIDQIDMAALGELEITKAVTSGTVFTATGTTWAADDLASAKIYVPVNLVNGETLVLAVASDNDDLAAALSTAAVDTALLDYTVANSSGTHTLTATAKTTATTASELSVTNDEALALSRVLDAITDTTTDVAAETALYNAMTANGGYGATEDTAFAKQVAPQDDMISGSTLASKAVTGTVQGIISNRMASLRSGDAYYGMGMSAGNMTAKSGFIQAFGSEVEQKNKTVGSGTQYGYESSSAGFALGFDGTTDTGATVGLSFSMSNTDLDGKGTGKAKNDIDSYTASLYWDKTGQNGYVEGSLTYGLNENKTSRLVNTAGLSRTYTGSYDSNQLSLSLGGGAPNAVGASGYVTPFIGVTGTYIKTDAYTESSTTAGDSLRLRVAQDDVNSLVGKVGVKYHNVTDKGTPMISLSLNNEFGDDTINSTNTYQGGGSSFTTSTDVEPLSATLGLGYSYGSDTASIEFAYEAEANDDKYLGHYGSIKIVGKF